MARKKRKMKITKTQAAIILGGGLLAFYILRRPEPAYGGGQGIPGGGPNPGPVILPASMQGPTGNMRLYG